MEFESTACLSAVKTWGKIHSHFMCCKLLKLNSHITLDQINLQVQQDIVSVIYRMDLKDCYLRTELLEISE